MAPLVVAAWLLPAAVAVDAPLKPRPRGPSVFTQEERARERVEGERPGIPLARLTLVAGSVERMAHRGSWARVEEGAGVATGDRLRTGADTTARVAFPWVQFLLGSGCEIAFPPSVVLSATLVSGRVEQRAEGGSLVRVRTPEVTVRGAGRVVVRRLSTTTSVAVLEGEVQLSTGGRSIATLPRGRGAIARGRERPELLPLPPSPAGLRPGADPRYVLRGASLELAWNKTGPGHVVEVLSLVDDEVLMLREVEGSSLTMPVPWEGTFRWRVAARSEAGLESLPSRAGYFCSVEK